MSVASHSFPDFEDSAQSTRSATRMPAMKPLAGDAVQAHAKRILSAGDAKAMAERSAPKTEDAAPPSPVDAWGQALQKAADGHEEALRVLIHESPNLLLGGAMDASLAQRLEQWSLLLRAPQALDTATWTLAASKSESSLAPHCAVFSLWARAAAHRQTPRGSADREAPPSAAALAMASLLRAPFSFSETQEAFALAFPPNPPSPQAEASAAVEARWRSPWMALACVARQDSFAAGRIMDMISQADFQQSVEDSYLPLLMWDPLAASLAWSALSGRGNSPQTLASFEVALNGDLRSIHELTRASLSAFLKGSFPFRREELESAATVLGLLERRLGHALLFDDPKWDALRSVFVQRELQSAINAPSDRMGGSQLGRESCGDAEAPELISAPAREAQKPAESSVAVPRSGRSAEQNQAETVDSPIRPKTRRL